MLIVHTFTTGCAAVVSQTVPMIVLSFFYHPQWCVRIVKVQMVTPYTDGCGVVKGSTRCKP